MEDDGSVATALASGGGGVLLYYKYLDLGEDGREAIRGWYEHACRSKGLRGRCVTASSGADEGKHGKRAKVKLPPMDTRAALP